MKKTRIFYDILSIFVVIVWVVGIILYQTLSVEVLFDYSMKIIIFMGIVSYLYTFSIVGLLIFLATKEKELPSMIVLIVACIILPIIIPVLAYFIVVRKLLKADSKK